MVLLQGFRFGRVARHLPLLFVLFLLCPACVLAQSAKNPGVVEIADPQSYKQILAVSDAHGMVERVVTLLRAANVITTDKGNSPYWNPSGTHWSGGKTLLIVCGDSIDKGPHSLPILRIWQQLMREAPAQGGRVVVLLGNHEAEFLADPNGSKTALFADELSYAALRPTEVAAGTDKKGIGKMLRALPLAARVGTYLFSHAGWYPAQMPWSAFAARAKSLLEAGRYDDPFVTGPHSILEEKDETAPDGDAVKWYDDPTSVRRLEQRITALGLYGSVFGHQPHAFGFKKKIGGVDDLRLIKIDSGMAPDGDDNPGELLRFPQPKDLLRFAPPTVERVLPDGTRAKVDVLSVATPK